MSRINKIQQFVSRIIDQITEHDEKQAAIIHTYGVAHCCSLLASKRRLNAELAGVCGLLHDIYSYKTGVRKFHSINGAEMVRVAFKYELKDIFTREEEMLIKSAIFHHADKKHIHDEYDEILKDADILQHWLFDVTSDMFVSNRLKAVQKELGLPISTAPVKPENNRTSRFSRILLGDIAEYYACKKIHGEKSDTDFMEIIRFYPETFAFDELINAWCAAFVYHCAISAGLELPIRHSPHANTRFACVEAWLKWGQLNGFCHSEKDGFTPERGDIVIYDNIIPTENKPANTPWYDHIGILLAINSETISVAESNVNNRNVSGIVERKRNENIGCYIRIPEDYTYDGWRYDYKTGKVRITEAL